MGWIQAAYRRLNGSYQQKLKSGSRKDLRGNRRLGFEALESRTLLSVVGYAKATEFRPIKDATAMGTTPNALRGAYGLGSYTAGVLSGGVSFAGVPGDGRGQTIALVDAYDDPSALTDLNAFSAHFGLPTFNSGSGSPTFSKLTQTGQSVSTNPSSPNYVAQDPNGPSSPFGNWEGEAIMDIEWAHAIAPMANIILFEAADDSGNLANLFTAVHTAASTPGVVAVSMSWADDEKAWSSSQITNYDSTCLTTPSGHLGGSAAPGGTQLPGGVTFLAASGDNGAYGNGDTSPAPEYPASSPNVVSVGGTTLTVKGTSPNYIYGSEKAWGDGINSGDPSVGGSGGGISAVEKLPSFQSGVVNRYSTTNRTFPDVSIEGDPATGVPVYDTYNIYGSGPWSNYCGGTSLGTPLWAGLIAIVDEGRAITGLGSLSSPQTLSQLYNLPAADFHDIISGSTGPSPNYNAVPGYDLATGLGSPVGSKLVPAMVNYLPTVTSISPAYGPSAGGTTVTITGTNLTGGTVVNFGSTPATNVTIVSATQITATSPAGTGTVYVTVTGPGGVSATSSAGQFAYSAVPSVASVSPSAVPLAGGTTVTINGNYFTGVTAVNFGAVAAINFTVNSLTQITATAPAGAGTVDVTVVNANGVSKTSSADQLTYEGKPTITSITPPNGKLAGGTAVTITGTNLAGATAVNFGSKQATITGNTPTQIVVVTPSGTGTVDVAITDPGGTSDTSTADKYAYVGPPTVATAASASPSPVTGLTTSLSVLGADVNGESTLTYTWAATTLPSGAAAPIFSVNATNGSKNTTATFSQAGAYTFTVTITDVSGQTATSSVNVTVNRTFSKIGISPANPTIYEDQTQQLTATAYDQFGAALATQPSFTWSKTSGVGSISAGGLFSSPSATGSAAISASSGSVTGTATVTVVPPAPAIVALAATPSPVNGTSTALSVQATDEHSQPSLTYTWAATSLSNGATAPTFSVNGANAAQNTNVTFHSAGTYTFTVTVTNALKLTATSSVVVTVNQTPTTIKATPASPTVMVGSVQQFSVIGYDQFGAAMASPPVCTWTTTVGQISASGLLTAPAAACSGTVTATCGTLSAIAPVTVIVVPTINAAYTLPDPLLPSTTSLFVYGTGTSDTILVNPATGPGVAKGSVTVLINGTSRGTFCPTGRIIIHGIAGNETIGVSPQVTTPAFIYGGSGNDILWGGGGANMIVGGVGKNTLYGGVGRSVLIAGSGASLLSAGGGDALLIAGTTNYSANDAALLAILNEWNSSQNFTTRAADIQGTNKNPLAQNGSYYLNASTVRSNGCVNHIVCSGGLAMFFQDYRDIVTGKKASAITVTIM